MRRALGLFRRARLALLCSLRRDPAADTLHVERSKVEVNRAGLPALVLADCEGAAREDRDDELRIDTPRCGGCATFACHGFGIGGHDGFFRV